MSNTEHVIALVAKLEDQASRGFNAMAGAAERAASRVEATQVKAAAAVAKTDQQVAKLGNDAVKAAKQVEQLGDAQAEQMRKAVQGAAATGAAFGSVSGDVFRRVLDTIGKLANSFLDLGSAASELKTFAGSMSLTTDEAQRFGFVAERFNVPITAMAQGSRALAKAIAEGSPVFRDLGIETKTADGRLRSVHDVMLDLADAFAGSNAEEAKLTIATKLLSESGRLLVPALNQGADALRRVEQQADATGRMLDESTIATLSRFDRMMKDVADRWNGFTIKIRVGIVRAVGGPEDTSGAGADAANWWQLQAQAAANLFPDRFQWDAQRRLASGSMSGLNDSERMRVNTEASRLLTEQENARAQAEAAAAKATQDAADKTDIAAAAARRFESTLQSLNERLSSRDLTTAQIDRLALAFNAGRESVRSLLEQLNTAEAVTKVVDRARFLVALVHDYGEGWRGADALTRTATDRLGTTEEKMRAVREHMTKLLEVTKQEVEQMGKLRPTGPGRTLEPGPRAPDVPRGAIPSGGGVPAKVFDWIGQQGRDVGADALIGVLQKIGAETDKSIDRWTAKFTVFRGFFGDLMQWLVAAAMKAFAKILEMQIFNAVLSMFTNVATGGVSAGAGGGAGPRFPAQQPFSMSPVAQDVATMSGSTGARGRVSRGTSVTINVSALDLGAVSDRMRSPFGALRLALEDALDSGRAG